MLGVALEEKAGLGAFRGAVILLDGTERPRQ
jgi:hypothetical protein